VRRYGQQGAQRAPQQSAPDDDRIRSGLDQRDDDLGGQIAITMQADSHLRWSKDVRLSSISRTVPTPETVPTARASASAEPV